MSLTLLKTPPFRQVQVVGDAFAAGRRDWMPLAPRVAGALGEGWVGVDAARDGGIAAAHRRLPDLKECEVSVLLLGVEDAPQTPPVRGWMMMWSQIFTALNATSRIVVVVLPPEPLNPEHDHGLESVGGYEKKARRWVRRLRQEQESYLSKRADAFVRTQIVICEGMVPNEWRSDAVWLKSSGYEAMAERIAEVVHRVDEMAEQI